MALEPHEYAQYGRQMIVPEIGLPGQTNLKKSAVLVVGAGGLGSPAIAYLAGAGVGTLGIVDGDTVETSNLHRQIVHSRATVGMLKCKSAAIYAQGLNPAVCLKTFATHLTAANALEICTGFDVILDCTDSPMSRYLVNDTAVILGVPLVSASALKTEGQLAIYNYKKGPCYRCIFPVPPPANAVGACSDAGIIGPVVGVMGVMQATEAVKIIACPEAEFTPSLLIYGAFSFPPWRAMKIRGRKPQCRVCGDEPRITAANLPKQDYVEFCGTATYPSLPPNQRIEFSKVTENDLVVDVRPATQFGITSIPGSINIPLAELKKGTEVPKDRNLVLVCRHGNDSREAVRILGERGIAARDIVGGLAKWGPHLGLPDY